MKLTVLGSGTSTGVPMIFCKCAVCRSRHPRNQRLRASVWIQVGKKSLLVDTSTDLRQQALRAKIPRVDAVLYTHPHSDHVHGIDELRSFNFVQKGRIPVYGNAWTCEELEARFGYIFKPTKVEGGGIPLLDLQRFDASVPELDVAGVRVVPVALRHGSKESVGFRFDKIAYVTDCSYIPSESLDRLKGLSVLVLDCLRYEPHATHFNLDQALETVERVKPKKTYLTHMSHYMEYASLSRKLPKGVFLAYDGLKISVKP